MSLFPIVHDHGENVALAERHLFALVNGGWAAKLKRPAGQGWQVIITEFRGFPAKEHYEGRAQADCH
jgi:hypothetical protein